MPLPQWSRSSLMLVGLMLAIGGFWAGSSSSQEQKPAGGGEVGRYQMVAASYGFYVFDTKTTRYWKYENENDWSNHLGPAVAGRVNHPPPNPDANPESN